MKLIKKTQKDYSPTTTDFQIPRVDGCVSETSPYHLIVRAKTSSSPDKKAIAFYKEQKRII